MAPQNMVTATGNTLAGLSCQARAIPEISPDVESTENDFVEATLSPFATCSTCGQLVCVRTWDHDRAVRWHEHAPVAPVTGVPHQCLPEEDSHDV